MADAKVIQPVVCEYGTGMSERMLVLHSADNGKLMVPEGVPHMLHSLKNKFINNQPAIYIFGTKLATLAIVIDYCMYLAGLSTVEKFHAQCNKQVDPVTLFNLIQAAHHQGIKSLMNYTCRILSYKVKCKTIEINKELNNQDACIQQYSAAKRLKRDFSEDKFVESILRNPRSQTFIMLWDYEDVPYHQFVASELRCINRKNSYFDGYIQKIMMLSEPGELTEAAVQLGQVIAGDRRLAESIEPNFFERLLDIVNNDHRGDIKHCAIAILSEAGSDKCRSLMESEVVPLLVKFVSDEYSHLATDAMIALTHLACAFPHSIDVIIKNHALEAVQTIVNGDYGVHHSISYSANFVAVICRNHDLPTEKARVALDISEAILLNPNHSYRDKAQACYILSYLSHKKQVVIKQETRDMLIDFIYCGVPMLAGSALGVIENIVRWGTFFQVEDFVKDPKFLRCLGKRMLCCCYKKFRKQACQIISNLAAREIISIEDMIKVKVIKHLCSLLKNEESDVQMEAAWALFNGINEYRHGQIDEYSIENDNYSESM